MEYFSWTSKEIVFSCKHFIAKNMTFSLFTGYQKCGKTKNILEISVLAFYFISAELSNFRPVSVLIKKRGGGGGGAQGSSRGQMITFTVNQQPRSTTIFMKTSNDLRKKSYIKSTSWAVLWLVTGHNGHKPKRPQPKRPQTETATNRNGHRPKRPQTETATNRNGHKPERPQTRKATNRNGHRPERPQTETPTSVVTPHISCHQNKYDGESPIGNDDIHANFVLSTNRNGHKPKRPQTGTATNRNGHRPERPQTETPTSVVTPHISCHQNKYDGESPIGNDDIHANFVLSANCVRNFITG